MSYQLFIWRCSRIGCSHIGCHNLWLTSETDWHNATCMLVIRDRNHNHEITKSHSQSQSHRDFSVIVIGIFVSVIVKKWEHFALWFCDFVILAWLWLKMFQSRLNHISVILALLWFIFLWFCDLRDFVILAWLWFLRDCDCESHVFSIPGLDSLDVERSKFCSIIWIV